MIKAARPTMAVGVSRTEPVVVSALRIDVVGAGQKDEQRQTVIVGDPNARWMPLLDQMKPFRQPVGIFGAAGHVIDRVGIVQSDGRTAPALGGRGGDTSFQIHIGLDHHEPSKRSDAFRGFHGTVCEFNGGVAIESLGMLFMSPEE